LTSLLLSQNSRGQFEQIDLHVSVPITDSDNNGLPDPWELFYFNQIGVDPQGDVDQDGFSNFAEWKAGTDPRDFFSQFMAFDVYPHEQGGMVIEWTSAANRTYTLLGSPNLLTGFTTIANGLVATPPVNAYHDTTAVGAGPYFYNVQLEN
jgi:hypothetical protein